jgi:SAM-dependent methyltransferase
MENYVEINAKTIDSWAREGWIWGIPITSEDFARAKVGDWDVVLTPLKPMPKDWFAPFLHNGKLEGVSLLGLASGGGQQMPIFAALGADCTLLDNSQVQLESDRMGAKREGYEIDIIRGDMSKTLPFANNSFDIIFHPVSNCYVEDVYHVWRECYRVLKPGGILVAGMDYGLNYLAQDDEPLKIVNKLPYNPLKNPAEYKKSIKNNDGIQFSHTVEEQIGGQLQAGLILTHLYEDTDNEGIGQYCPNYIATRAVKK